MNIKCYIVYFIFIIIILNLSVFFFHAWNGMICIKYIIVFSLRHYTSPDNIIGKLFSREKTIIE